MKKLIAFVLGVCFCSGIFASKDIVAGIPTGNIAIGAYEMFSTSGMLSGKFVGRNVLCTVGVINSWNGQPLNIHIWTSNYSQENGDTPDGFYQIAASVPLKFYKFNVHCITPGVYSYIRFYNINENASDTLMINCSYI